MCQHSLYSRAVAPVENSEVAGSGYDGGHPRPEPVLGDLLADPDAHRPGLARRETGFRQRTGVPVDVHATTLCWLNVAPWSYNMTYNNGRAHEGHHGI